MTVAVFTLPAAPPRRCCLAHPASVLVPMPGDTPMPELDLSRCREAPQCRCDTSCRPNAGLTVGVSAGGAVRAAPGEVRGTRERQRELSVTAWRAVRGFDLKEICFIRCKLQ